MKNRENLEMTNTFCLVCYLFAFLCFELQKNFRVCASPQYAKQEKCSWHRHELTPKAQAHTKETAAAAAAASVRSGFSTPLTEAARRTAARGVNKHTWVSDHVHSSLLSTKKMLCSYQRVFQEDNSWVAIVIFIQYCLYCRTVCVCLISFFSSQEERVSTVWMIWQLIFSL